MGVTYGPQEVAAQIKAAQDNGMPSFLLWNAGARYQGAALGTKK
jgi:putative glycosyl hydrolase protein